MKGQLTNCPTCGNSFVRKRKNHKFCKNSCRQKNHRAKHGIEEPFKNNVSGNASSNVLPNVTQPQFEKLGQPQRKVRTPDYEIRTLRVHADYWARVHDDAIKGIFPLVTIGSSGLGYAIASEKGSLGDKVLGTLVGAFIGNVIDEQRRDAIIKNARRNYDTIIQRIRSLQDASLVVENLQGKGVLSLPNIDGTMEVINSNDYKKLNIPTLGFNKNSKWFYLLGDPAPGFYKLVTGKPGNGKSTYCVEFAEYFNNHHGKVLYLASEQRGLNKSLQRLLKRFNATFDVSMKPNNDLQKLSSILSKYKLVVIDSINHLGLSADDVETLRASNPDLSIVAVMQSTKDGSYKGSQEFLHNCDIKVNLENMTAHQTKSRFSQPSEIALISDDSQF